MAEPVKGFDSYAPADDALAARAVERGFSFQGVYYGRGPKVFQPKHVPVFARRGLAVICYFERYADRARAGVGAGRHDAVIAIDQASAVGQPAFTPIYFAVDFDAAPEDIIPYFKGAADALNSEVLPSRRYYLLAAYGGGAVGEALRSEGLISHFCEAGASGWRGSGREFRPDKHSIKQFPEIMAGAPNNELGIQYDMLLAESLASAGAWFPDESMVGGAARQPSEMGDVRRGETVSAPAAPAATGRREDEPRVAIFLEASRKIQGFLAEKTFYKGAIDGDFGPRSRAAFRRYLASK